VTDTLPPFGMFTQHVPFGLVGHSLTSIDCEDPLIVTLPVPGVPTGLPTTTVSVWLITVIVPLRSAVPEFGAAL